MERDTDTYEYGTAEALSSIPDEEYQPPSFVPSKLVNSIAKVPRFAHSSSIAYAAGGNDDARQDYLEGAVFVSAMVLLTFVVWLIILIVLKVMGASRVGCAAGKAPTYPSLESIQAANHTLEREYEHDAVLEAEGRIKGEQSVTGGQADENHEDMTQWLNEVKVIEKRMRRVRIVFLVCGVIIIPASLVLIAAGFRVLDGALKATQQNVMATKDIIDNNLQRVDALIMIGKQAAEVRDAAVEELASWCPNAAGGENNLIISAEGVPSTLEFIDNGDGTLSVSFYNDTKDLLNALDALEDFIVPGSERVEEALLLARNHAVNTYNTFEETSWWFYFAVAFTVLIVVLAIVFMVGACLAWTYRLPQCFERLQTYGIFPIFAGLLGLLWLCVSGFAFALVLNADLCSGSPEENVVAILHQKEIDMDQLLFGMASYYIEGCTLKDKPDKPTSLFDDFLPYLESGIDLSQSFTSKIGSIDMSSLSRACGFNVKSTTNTMTYLLQTLDAVQERTAFMVEGLYCSNFNPIYSKNMYEAICYDGVRGLTAIFACLFVITVAGMTMISLRVAFHEVRNESNWMEELGLDIEYSEEKEGEGEGGETQPNNNGFEVIEEAITEIGDDGALHEA